MTKGKKIALVAAIVVVALLAWKFWPGRGASDTPPTTAVVTRGTVAQTVLASGQVEAYQLVSVGARASGQIETLPVALGQDVKKGDVIATLDSRDQENSVRQKQANLADIEAQIVSKQADLRKAQLILDRQNKLGQSDYSSRETVESAQADVDMLTAGLTSLAAQKASAEIDVQNAQITLGRTQITAPISGTVVAVVQQQGATVNATQSAPTIVKIADLDKVLIKAEISEADVVKVAPGQKVTFTILGEPDKTYQAVLRNIEPAPSAIKDSDTIDTDTAIYYNGRFEVDNPDHKLRIGMTTSVTITQASAENVLTVPASALIRKGQGYQVMVFDPASGQVSARDVEIGLNDKVTAEVKSGLKENERVVVTAAAASTTTTSSGRMGPPPMGF